MGHSPPSAQEPLISKLENLIGALRGLQSDDYRDAVESNGPRKVTIDINRIERVINDMRINPVGYASLVEDNMGRSTEEWFFAAEATMATNLYLSEMSKKDETLLKYLTNKMRRRVVGVDLSKCRIKNYQTAIAALEGTDQFLSITARYSDIIIEAGDLVRHPDTIRDLPLHVDGEIEPFEGKMVDVVRTGMSADGMASLKLTYRKLKMVVEDTSETDNLDLPELDP